MQGSTAFIPCPFHPQATLNRIDPDPRALKHVYCTECLLQHKDANSMYKRFLTLQDLVMTAAESYSRDSGKLQDLGKPKKSYQDVLAGKTEALSKLSDQISSQKEHVNTLYDELEQTVKETIDECRKRDLRLLEEQNERLQKFYDDFEHDLKAAYPSPEEVSKLFPTNEQLLNQLNSITEAERLEDLIKKLKQDLFSSLSSSKLIFQTDQVKKEFLDLCSRRIKEEEVKKPTVTYKFDNLKDAQNSLKAHLDIFFRTVFVFRNSVTSESHSWESTWNKLPIVSTTSIPHKKSSRPAVGHLISPVSKSFKYKQGRSSSVKRSAIDLNVSSSVNEINTTQPSLNDCILSLIPYRNCIQDTR